MKEKLRLLKRDKLTYIVPVPERFRNSLTCPSKIKIVFCDGEYQYAPRKHTFGAVARLSFDELSLIVEELKKLNAGK